MVPSSETFGVIILKRSSQISPPDIAAPLAPEVSTKLHCGHSAIDCPLCVH